MKRYDGLWLFSDVDGTLLTDSYLLPDRSRAALETFVSEGGKLSLATGRGASPTTRELVKSLPINAPCVLNNGAVLYDFASEKLLDVEYLPDTAYEMMKRFVADLPELRASVWTLERRFEVGASVYLPPCANFRRMEDIEERWVKLVFRVPVDERLSVMDRLSAMGLPGLRVASSGDSFVEVMPQGVDKGRGVLRVMELFGLMTSQVVTAGDYYNDYEMLCLPGVVSYCPENSPDDIKRICRESLCSVEDGFVAELIERL